MTPDDTAAIARVTLPLGSQVQIAISQDIAQKTITISSPNLNLQIAGMLAPQMGPAGCPVGFQALVSNSLLQVAEHDGRFYCRDGHTRALQLLKHGITHVPALVKTFADYSEIAPRLGLLTEAVTRGSNGRSPDPFTVLDGERRHELAVRLVVAHQVKAVTDHGGRRIASTDVGEFPTQLRSVFRPLFQQTLLG